MLFSIQKYVVMHLQHEGQLLLALRGRGRCSGGHTCHDRCLQILDGTMCVKLSDTRRSAVPDISSALSAGEALPAAPGHVHVALTRLKRCTLWSARETVRMLTDLHWQPQHQ